MSKSSAARITFFCLIVRAFAKAHCHAARFGFHETEFVEEIIRRPPPEFMTARLRFDHERERSVMVHDHLFDRIHLHGDAE